MCLGFHLKEDAMNSTIDGLEFIPKKIFRDERGAVFHMMREGAEAFQSPAEVYFSSVKAGTIKGWKYQYENTQRFAVPVGSVRFVFYDARQGSKTNGAVVEIDTGPENYGLLCVPSKIWYSFQGLGDGESLIVNCASVAHNANKGITEPLDSEKIPYQWSL